MQDRTIRLRGLVLSVVRYGAAHQLATVYTLEKGMLKCTRRGALSLRGKNGGPALTPLAEVELVIQKNSSELHLCKEAVCLHRFHQDFTEYHTLELACSLANVLQCSQPLESPSPPLYHLFLRLLQTIRQFRQPELALAALQLKLLYHEGLINPINTCQICQSSSSPLKVLRGDPFCVEHAPPFAIPLSTEELEAVNWLMQTRQLSVLQQAELPMALMDKVERLFRQQFPVHF